MKSRRDLSRCPAQAPSAFSESGAILLNGYWSKPGSETTHFDASRVYGMIL